MTKAKSKSKYKGKEYRLIKKHHIPESKYKIAKEPAYWTTLTLLVFAGFMLVVFSNIQPPEGVMAAPELNTILGFKITTVFIVFVLAAIVFLIILVARRFAKRQRETIAPEETA